MPRVSDEHLESRRKDILQAAWRCFGRKGFHQTTMRDICAEAELSAGAVYQYFSGKDDLIRAVAEEGRRSGAARMASPDAASDPLEALISSVRQFLACLDDKSALSSLRVDVRLMGEAVHDGPVRDVALENYEHLITGLADLIERAQRAKNVNGALPPRTAARILIALFQGLELQRVLDPQADIAAAAGAVETLLRGRFA